MAAPTEPEEVAMTVYMDEIQMLGSCCMPRVPDSLFNELHQPMYISIGPYHYGKPTLTLMENMKKSVLWAISDQVGRGIAEFTEAMTSLAYKARSYYIEPLHPDFGSKKFLDMLVYDAGFIVQLLTNMFAFEKVSPAYDIEEIKYDLLLLENQIPFIVIFEWYKLIVPFAGDMSEFSTLVLRFFGTSPRPLRRRKVCHLLELIHSNSYPTHFVVKDRDIFEAEATKVNAKRWTSVPNASKLTESGITFHGDTVPKIRLKNPRVQGRFDISFIKASNVLQIPVFEVDRHTKGRLANFVAFEMFFRHGQPKYWSSYVLLLGGLIQNAEDVDILRKSGVISPSPSITTTKVIEIFNTFQLSAYKCEPEDIFYSHIFHILNEGQRSRWNKWIALLKRDYLGNPWSLIQLMAAALILLAGIVQALVSVVSFIKQYGM